MWLPATVKTPLPKLVAVFDEGDRDRGALSGDDELAAIVRHELNVKRLEVRDRAEGLVREVVYSHSFGPDRVCCSRSRSIAA